MVERYMKLQPFINSSVEAIYALNFVFGALKPCLQFTSAETDILWRFSGLMQNTEAGNALLGAEKSPTIHLKELFTGLI